MVDQRYGEVERERETDCEREKIERDQERKIHFENSVYLPLSWPLYKVIDFPPLFPITS